MTAGSGPPRVRSTLRTGKAPSRLGDYLDHMLEAVKLARSYVKGLSKENFLLDKKTQQAVILNIVIIGEAAAQIGDNYPEFAAQHPDMPWKQMRGMRNRMAHGYFEVNLDIVWDTVQTSLPLLESQLVSAQGGAEPGRTHDPD